MSTRRVLLVNELGAGSGHARKLAAIAAALTGAGFHCDIALPDPRVLPATLRTRKTSVETWPVPEKTKRENVYAGSYGDILALTGFGDPERLRAALAAVEQRLLIHAPDILIADFSPVAMLAAAGRIPVLWTGHSYATPPLEAPRFQKFRTENALDADEDKLCEVISGVQSARGAPYFSDLPSAFSHASQIVCCSAETDIYAATRMGRTPGHVRRYDPLPLNSGAGIVGYLYGSHYGLEALIDGLVAARVSALLYVVDPPPWLEGRIAGTPVILSTEPLVFPNDLRNAALVVHSGGASLAEEALSLGLPQLVAPMQIEQHLIAEMLERYGLVHHLWRGFSVKDVVEGIGKALLPESRARTHAHAIKMQNVYGEGAIPVIIAAARALKV